MRLPFVLQLYELANAEKRPNFDYLVLSKAWRKSFSTASFLAKVSDRNLTSA
jgi:hypothetical protein